MSAIEGAARPRATASPPDVVPTARHRLTPSGGAPSSTPAAIASVTAAKCRSVIAPAAPGVAALKARTAPQNGESIGVAPWYGWGCPSSPPNRHMSVPGFTTNPVAPWFVPAFTLWVVDPTVMLPGCTAVGAVQVFTGPHASSGAARSAAGAVGVGAGGDGVAGVATLPQATRTTARHATIGRIPQASRAPLRRSRAAGGQHVWGRRRKAVGLREGPGLVSYYAVVGGSDDPHPSGSAPGAAPAPSLRLLRRAGARRRGGPRRRRAVPAGPAHRRSRRAGERRHEGGGPRGVRRRERRPAALPAGPLLPPPTAGRGHRRVSQMHPPRVRGPVQRLRGSLPLSVPGLHLRQAHGDRDPRSGAEA